MKKKTLDSKIFFVTSIYLKLKEIQNIVTIFFIYFLENLGNAPHPPSLEFSDLVFMSYKPSIVEGYFSRLSLKSIYRYPPGTKPTLVVAALTGRRAGL